MRAVTVPWAVDAPTQAARIGRMMPSTPEARPLKSYQVSTPRGPVYLQAQNLRPHILMIHGFMRHPAMLEHWCRLIPDLGFINLPGHGGAGDLDEVSLQAWIEAGGSAPAVVDTAVADTTDKLSDLVPARRLNVK